MRLQRAWTMSPYTQGAATLYPGLCASALTARAGHCIICEQVIRENHEQSHFGYNKLDTLLNKSPSFWPFQTQSIATANAKLCNRQRKALQSSTQSFAFAYAKLCIRQCKRFWGKARYIYNLFTHFSLHVIAATKGKISIYFFAVTYVFTIFASYWVCDWENTYY